MTSSKKDRIVGQPGQRVQQHLRVFVDGARRVATVSTQSGEPDIGRDEAGTQLQIEALFVFRALLRRAILKIPADLTEATRSVAMEDKKLFHSHYSLLTFSLHYTRRCKNISHALVTGYKRMMGVWNRWNPRKKYH